MKKKVLIIGGTSGLGWSIASLFAQCGSKTLITGRNKPEQPLPQRTLYETLDLSFLPDGIMQFEDQLEVLSEKFERPDLLVYSAGFFQDGTIAELDSSYITKMIGVGLFGPIFIIRHLLRKWGQLPELCLITSTSEWTPRRNQPVYTAVKGGSRMLAESFSLDGRIGKVLVAAPSGMNTPFWNSTARDDRGNMLDPKDVASIIVEELYGEYRFKHMKILREPLRVEIHTSR